MAKTIPPPTITWPLVWPKSSYKAKSNERDQQQFRNGIGAVQRHGQARNEEGKRVQHSTTVMAPRTIGHASRNATIV